MPDTVDISVVIPTRGRPGLLRRAVASALLQDVPSLEVIVVVDGPDAATEAALQQIGDVRVKVVLLENPVGGAEARNVGARTASGRYIALLDDDDEWLAGKLKAQLALADAFEGKVFVVVTKYIVRRAGRGDELWPVRLPKRGQPLSEFLFSACGGFQTSTYLCPRELFLRRPFIRGLRRHQDWDWFLRLAALPGFTVLVVEQPLSIYWVAQHSRASVSESTDWKFSRDWATENIELMTRKAYASFLVKVCARDPKLQCASAATKFGLLHDLMTIGRPTMPMLVEFAACVVVGEELRLRARPIVQWWRSATAALMPTRRSRA